MATKKGTLVPSMTTVPAQPTHPDLINFFRLCRIVLEDIPDVLCTVFKDEISNKQKQKWIDGKKCGQWLLRQERFDSKLNGTQKQLLASGQTNKWDVTLLVHTLLYSSQLLLTDSFPDNQVSLKHSDPSKLLSTSSRADFTRHLRPKDIILCDLGQELARNEVKYVGRSDITLKYPMKSQNPPQVIDVYLCSRDWMAVENLSRLRNTQFAHCRNARIDTSSLTAIVRNIETWYLDLRIPKHRIGTMTSILSENYGDEVLFQSIKDYRDKWHAEIEHYVEVKKGVEYLQSDVEEMKLVLKDIEKDSQAQKVFVKQQHEDIKELKTDVAQTKESVSGIQETQQVMEERVTDTSSRLVSLESQQEEKQADIVILQRQQSEIASHVSHTVKLIKQVSGEQKTIGEKVSSLEVTERQVSAEVEKTGELIHQLSVKEDEMHDEVKVLKDEVDVIKSDMVKVKEEIDVIQLKGPSTKLSVSHFESDISYYSDKYHAGTRQWLLDDIVSWKKKALGNRNQPNMCIVSGNPGMGKSVLAARLCSSYKQEGALAGCFFFQHHLGKRSNPKMLVQTLCHQFLSTVNGYSNQVEDELARIDPEALTTFELFSYLIKEPLSCLSSPSKSMMVVIDALDECDYDSRPDLLKLLIRDFIKLPQWIQIILTTRPDKKILSSLKRIKSVIEINPDDSRNLDDIRLFLRDFLRNKMSKEELDSGVELLVEKSEGMFLYFHYAIDTLEEKEHVSLAELKNLLPDGIDDYYELNFHRLFDSLGQKQYQIFLQGILMARSDFPQDLVGPLLGIPSEEARTIISMVSTLLPLHDGSICIFHKSVRDWLLDKELAGQYAIDPLAGHKHLAILCQAELKSLKSKFSSSSLSIDVLANCPVYRFIVQNAVHHICQGIAPHLLSQILNVIEDLQFMYFRLVCNFGGTAGLLDDINESLTVAANSRKLHQALLDCYEFVRRHTHVLDGNPSLIFQCALNEPRVFSERLGVSLFLADPLRAFPGLKVLLQVDNKSEIFTSSLITFSCDDIITSSTLSSDSNLLIGSDVRGFVYFWNVQTGELNNKVDLSDEYSFPYSINSLCNVSADSNLLAYGSLNEVLNFEGEKIPLLKTKVKHEINTCIFSPNGENILAFAFYQDGMFRLFEEIQLPLKVDFHVQMWKVSTCKYRTLQVIKQKENRPMCACFSADGKRMFCGYRNGNIVAWDPATCEPLAYLLSTEVILREEIKDIDINFLTGTMNTVHSIVVSHNNHFLAVCSKENLQLWDAAALVFITAHTPKHPGSNYTECSFSQDNSYLAAGTTNGYLEIFAIKNFTFIRIASSKPEGSSNLISGCLFINPSNVSCTIGNCCQVYELEDLIQSSQRESKNVTAIHPGVANTAIVLPQRELAITLGKKTLCLWNVINCELISSAVEMVGGFLLRLSADGKTLLTYGDRCYIEVWDVCTLTKTRDLVHLKQKNLPIGDDDPDQSSPTDICHCAVSVDGIVVGGTGNGDLFMWHGENLALIKELDIHESLITFIEFSPCGTAFVSSDMDGVVMMWRLSNERDANLKVNMIPLACHSDSVEQICYSSQGRRLVTCSMDKFIHLYNGPSGDLIAKLNGHSSGVMRAIFSSNESMIASGGDNGEIIIWDGVTGQLLQCIKPKVKKIVLDLQFVKQDKFICSRDSNAGYITVNETKSGSEVSRLSFATEISTMSASSHWKESAYLLCCLKDGSVKFVKVLDSDSMNIFG